MYLIVVLLGLILVAMSIPSDACYEIWPRPRRLKNPRYSIGAKASRSQVKPLVRRLNRRPGTGEIAGKNGPNGR
jgi:hypothetical protein